MSAIFNYSSDARDEFTAKPPASLRRHATAAEFGSRSAQRLAAAFTGRTVEREFMVVDGIGIGFLRAGDLLVFRQKADELLSQVAFGEIALGQTFGETPLGRAWLLRTHNASTIRSA
jgi:hypothetical protein